MLKAQELAGGYNFVKSYDVDDLVANQTDTQNVTITVYNIPQGTVIKDVTLYSPAGTVDNALLTYTAEVGDADNPDGFVAQAGFAANVGIIEYADGAYLNDGTTYNVVNGKKYAADGTLTLTITALIGTLAQFGTKKFYVLANVLAPQVYLPK